MTEAAAGTPLGDGRDARPVPVSRWGRDHWSTFAYVCSCIFDRREVDPRRMRTDPALHPCLAHGDPFGSGVTDGSKYPTRLRGGALASPHDDWSCLDDAEAAGLVVNRGTGLRRDYQLTEAGLAAHAALAAHFNAGGAVSGFTRDDAGGPA